jgi:hypothetical protein
MTSSYLRNFHRRFLASPTILIFFKGFFDFSLPPIASACICGTFFLFPDLHHLSYEVAQLLVSRCKTRYVLFTISPLRFKVSSAASRKTWSHVTLAFPTFPCALRLATVTQSFYWLEQSFLPPLRLKYEF